VREALNRQARQDARFWLVFGGGDNDAVFDSARAVIVTVTDANLCV